MDFVLKPTIMLDNYENRSRFTVLNEFQHLALKACFWSVLLLKFLNGLN